MTKLWNRWKLSCTWTASLIIMDDLIWVWKLRLVVHEQYFYLWRISTTRNKCHKTTKLQFSTPTLKQFYWMELKFEELPKKHQNGACINKQLPTQDTSHTLFADQLPVVEEIMERRWRSIGHVFVETIKPHHKVSCKLRLSSGELKKIWYRESESEIERMNKTYQQVERRYEDRIGFTLQVSNLFPSMGLLRSALLRFRPGTQPWTFDLTDNQIDLNHELTLTDS